MAKMAMMGWAILLLPFLIAFEGSSCRAEELKKRPPHIIAILADDLGWYDVGFHGSNQLRTPNLDALAYNGVALQAHYAQPLCTPSRAAFLTGRYPLRLGMQHSVILESEPRGLPLGETLMPERLRSEGGYATHAVGKWHLGYFREEYAPTRRGFDSHYGYWNGFQDYYNHSVKATFDPSMIGYDMRRNMDVDYSARGNYSTRLFTKEAVKLIREHDDSSKPMFLYLAHLAPHTGNIGNAFQAPDEQIARFAHIKDPERRVYAAMVAELDNSVGEVVAALRQKGMLDNCIILFLSDNGAPTYGVHSNRGSNYPLRGQKDSPWEGGSRTVGAIWSSEFKKTKRVYKHMIHITDWLPTFWSAMGRDPSELGQIDGVSVWDALVNDLPSPRTDLVVNIDPVSTWAAVRRGKWKYVEGGVATPISQRYDGWYGEFGRSTEPYDSMGVVASRAAVSLLGYATDRQIMAKYDSSSVEFSPLTVEDVELLRAAATLTCNDDATTVDRSPCRLNASSCLFDIESDPCEKRDVTAENANLVIELQKMAEEYRAASVAPANVPADPRADPRLHGGVWTSWADDDENDGVSKIAFEGIFKGWSRGSKLAFKWLCLVAGAASLLLICAQIKRHLEHMNKQRNEDTSSSKVFLGEGHYVECGLRKAPIVNSSVSVAKRIEMFEESNGKLRN